MGRRTSGTLFSARWHASCGMTVIELTVAIGILAVTVGGLIQIVANVNTSQQASWNRQVAMRTARNLAEDIRQASSTDWEQFCAGCNSIPGVRVAVEDGDGAPGSGWAKITVRVHVPPDAVALSQEAVLVFGRTR